MALFGLYRLQLEVQSNRCPRVYDELNDHFAPACRDSSRQIVLTRVETKYSQGFLFWKKGLFLAEWSQALIFNGSRPSETGFDGSLDGVPGSIAGVTCCSATRIP